MLFQLSDVATQLAKHPGLKSLELRATYGFNVCTAAAWLPEDFAVTLDAPAKVWCQFVRQINQINAVYELEVFNCA